MVLFVSKQNMVSEFQNHKTSEADCWKRSSILATEYLPKEKCLIFSILINYICFAFNYLILNYKKRIKEGG